MPVLLVGFNMCDAGPHRLTTIDESASILSDISYDKTDDSLVSTSPVKNEFTLCKEKRSLVMCEVPLSCCSSTVSGLGLFQSEDGATEEKGEEGGLSRQTLFRSSFSCFILHGRLFDRVMYLYLFVSAPQGITSMVLLWLPNDLDRQAELPKW